MVELLRDLQDDSKFDDPYDPISIISQSPVKDFNIQGEIINVIMPHSLQGEVYQDIGDIFTYCLSSESSKRLGNLRYAARSCQIKYPMRAAASFNKIAGFPKVSAYKNINILGPGILVMGPQFEAILDRMSATYSDMAETRNICISQNPTASNTLKKEALMIRMVEGATKDDRLRVMNTVLAAIEESAFLTIDLVDH